MEVSNIKAVVLIAVLSLALASAAIADPALGNGQSKYSIGFQSSWPSYGLSGKMDVSDDFTAQAVIGFAGNVQMYSVRGLFTLKRQKNTKVYAYGALGVYRASTFGISESVFGYGAGVGGELRVSEEIPISVSLELGLQMASFDRVSETVGSLGLGLGVHYRL